MKMAVIGAGMGGMSAAFNLANAGYDVTIYEAADHAGGLAAGLKQPHWKWSVEHYYHHWFASDRHMFKLIRELGLQDKVIYKRPLTVVYYNNKFYPLDSPAAALTFPGFNLVDMARFGLVTIYLRYLTSWQRFEKFTAHEWMPRAYGERVYKVIWEPLLVGKFGPHYMDVNMAWFWARAKARTTRLVTYEGGFQAFADEFAGILKNRGVKINLSTQVKGIEPMDGGMVRVTLQNESRSFDRVLVTLSPAQLAGLAPSLPAAYLQGLLSLKSMGAVVIILALSHQLSKEGYYWYNLPKSAGYPFLAMVEHTNFVQPEDFGGQHIVYLGDYLDPQHENFSLSKEQLMDKFLPSLERFNPEFSREWVQGSWLFRTSYAQPVPLLNHSRNIPAIRTPIPGLYYASMSQVYPWDRGTNYAVEIGRNAARLMLEDTANA